VCGCKLIFHLKTEDEYDLEALDDRDEFDDDFEEFEDVDE